MYVKDKDKNNHRYMKCAEFRKGCPGRASLNLETGNFPLQQHMIRVDIK